MQHLLITKRCMDDGFLIGVRLAWDRIVTFAYPILHISFFNNTEYTHLEVMQKEKKRYQNLILYRTRHVMIHPTPKLGN